MGMPPSASPGAGLVERGGEHVGWRGRGRVVHVRSWTSVCSNVVSRSTYPVAIGSQHVELPVVSLVERTGAGVAHHGGHGRGVHASRRRGIGAIARALRRRHRRHRGDHGDPGRHRSHARARTRSVRHPAQDPQDPPRRRGHRARALHHHRRRSAPALRPRAHSATWRASASPSSTTSSRRVPPPVRRCGCCTRSTPTWWRSAPW